MTLIKLNKSEPNAIPITYPGAYLYQAPHLLHATLDKELAVIFCIKNTPTTGLVFYDPSLSTKNLLSDLELLHLKIKSKLKVHTNQISLKLFGLSSGAQHIYSLVKEWADSLGISITATELGKGLIRNISIDCSTAIVGVKLGELNIQSSKPLFLHEGTARERIPLANVHNKILILTQNTVQRQLTKAAVEEHPAWAAQTVDEISPFLKSSNAKNTQWSVILCFEDINDEKNLEKFLKEVKSSHPSTEIRWVGSHVPGFLESSNIKVLPPIDYALLPDFKKMLKRAVFDANLAMNFESVKISKSKTK